MDKLQITRASKSS